MFYIYTGEMYLIKQEIKKVAKEIPIMYVDTIEPYYNSLFTDNLFGDYNCYVVTDDKFIIDNDKVKKKLSTDKFNNIVVLILQNTNKRNGLYKKATIVNKMDKGQISNLLHRQFKIEKKYGEQIAELCDCDLSYILLEINKVVNYNMNLQKLLDDNMIGLESEDVVFNYTNKFMYRQLSDLFELNHNFTIQQNVLPILQMIYNNVRNVLQVINYNGDNISKTTGLLDWQIRTAKNQAKNFSTDKCIYILKLIYQLQKQMKIGEIEQDKILDILVLKSF